MPKNEETWKRLQPDARRNQILDAARSAFAHNGYAHTSMVSIGREAGVTPGLVNHYFGGKQDLYLAVIDGSARTLSRTVRTDLRELPEEERILRNTREFLDSIERDRDDWILLFGARGQADSRLTTRLERVRSEAIERMSLNLTGEVEPGDGLRLVLRVFQGTAEAAAVEWISGRATREQVEEILVASLKALVRKPLRSAP